MITAKLLGRQAIREFGRKMSDAKIYRKLIRFDAENGRNVELEAVFELNIRFIGLNYPGFTLTSSYEGQEHGNIERQNYSNALLNELGIEGKVVYMGHSRGWSQSDVPAGGDQFDLPSASELSGNAMMLGIYKAIGFKIQTGEEAINALRSMIRVSLGGQLEFIEKTNEMKELKKLIVFSGNDHLVEQEIIFESLEKHEGLQHFNFDDVISDEDKQKVLDSYSNDWGASVFVAKDTHFQNKSRADLIADACQTILQAPAAKNKL
ncbi:unnamed protein product [Caenorhabditis sp. 36 PRJEB53466]|nr:unnamed protein product [Caenorhabditis sp. 36 PRJEB53466]